MSICVVFRFCFSLRNCLGTRKVIIRITKLIGKIVWEYQFKNAFQYDWRIRLDSVETFFGLSVVK